MFRKILRTCSNDRSDSQLYSPGVAGMMCSSKTKNSWIMSDLGLWRTSMWIWSRLNASLIQTIFLLLHWRVDLWIFLNVNTDELHWVAIADLMRKNFFTVERRWVSANLWSYYRVLTNPRLYGISVKLVKCIFQPLHPDSLWMRLMFKMTVGMRFRRNWKYEVVLIGQI